MFGIRIPFIVKMLVTMFDLAIDDAWEAPRDEAFKRERKRLVSRSFKLETPAHKFQSHQNNCIGRGSTHAHQGP